MKLWLFGVELVLDGQGKYHGPLGTGAGSAGTTVTIIQPSPGQIAIDFSGPLPFASDVSFACICACDHNDPMQLQSVTSMTRKASARLTLPLNLQTLNIDNGDVVTLNNQNAGLGLVTPADRLRGALKLVPLNSVLGNTDWVGDADWDWRTFLTFLAPGQSIVFLPGDLNPAICTVSDQFLDATAIPFLDRWQTLDFLSATLTTNQALILSAPRDNALHLHPDLLDCRQDGTTGYNSFLYQYAMVNGDLEISLPGTGGKSADIAWKPTSRPNSPTTGAGMLLFRHSDEHGHPILLESDSFPIGFREGSSVQKGDGSPATEWEWTNRAACVYQDTADIKVNVHAIDPLKLGDINHSEKNWWLKDGFVHINEKSGPAELHGAAKGLVVKVSDGTGISSAKLRTAAVRQADGAMIFAHTTLDLSIPSTPVHVQPEERHYSPNQFTSSKVGFRESQIQVGATVSLPVIDTSFALSNLADEAGRVTQGLILEAGKDWLQGLNSSFISALGDPVLDLQTHSSRFQVQTDIHPLHTVISVPPGIAATPAETARTGVALKQKTVGYLHGGDRGAGAFAAIQTQMAIADATTVGPFLRTFKTFWNKGWDISVNDQALRTTLRTYMSLMRLLSLEEDLANSLLPTVIEAVYGSVELQEFDAATLIAIRAKIPSTLDAATLIKLWKSETEPKISALFDAVWAPATESVFRRAMEAVFDPQSALTDAVKSALVQKFPGFTLSSLTANVTDGLLSAVPQGLDSVVEKLLDLWRLAPELQPLRLKYGSALTPDIYRRFLDPTKASIDDLWPLLLLLVRTDVFIGSLAFQALKASNAAINEAMWKALTNLAQIKQFLLDYNPHFPFDYLSRLSFEPPEYVFVNGRLNSAGAADNSTFRQLWNQIFHACDLGDGQTFWKFLLDRDSSVIVKLTGARKIEDILKEIHDAYKTLARPNPLGLPVTPGDTMEKALSDFVAKLDSQIVEKFWRGVLVVRPTIDIGGDRQLSTLCGLQHIDALWCAVGGGKADSTGPALTLLDVYAYIHQEKLAQPDDANPGDTSLTLIKFEATIRNTKLVAGEVIFRLDLRNLWGKMKSDTFHFDTIMLRGTLPQDKQGNVGSSFEFAAWLPEPARFDIDLAFIQAFVFRSLRVGKNKGQTSIEIDGDIELKKWDTGIGGFPFSIDPGQDGTGQPLNKIQLLNFRILVPEIPSGQSVLMGARRLLNFEFPAVEFHVPKPRTINLWADIELTPFAMGFVRLVSDAGDAFSKLTSGYQWLFGDVKPTADSFPYMRCTIDFGKLPKFGGTQLSDLHLELLLGIVLDGTALPKVALGVSSLEARDIVLDLFGILKLEVQDLILGRFLSGPTGTDQITSLMATNVKLTILGWSPTPSGSELDLILAQRPPDNQAALVWYSAKAPTSAGTSQPPDDSFVRLNWLLLARNWILDPKILNYLLDSGAEGSATPDLMKNLVMRPPSPGVPGKINGTVDKNAGWLLGIQFALGDLLDDCTLVLHDQHYYGISLRGELVELLFEQPRLELAYIPGATRAQDRFRTTFRIPKLNMLGLLQSGEFAVEWGFNWDYLLDFGFPWKQGAAYVWERAFSLPVGAYEAKFGFYFEKRSQPAPNGANDLTIAAGVGFYIGYYVGFGTPGQWVWARAGIGVFAILEGAITFREPGGGGVAGLLKASIQEIYVVGVIGIYAYGEGGISIWVISASFRVSIQAAIAGELHYIANASTTLGYAATLEAHYEASCRVGCGFFSFTFSVSGDIGFEVSGHAVLN